MTTTESKTTQGTWHQHMMEYKTEHNVSLKEAMKGAAATYTKQAPRVKKDKGDYKPNPWMAHIAEWRKANPDWKTNHSYKEVLSICKETYGKENVPPKAVSSTPAQPKVFSGVDTPHAILP